jgi:hypothetical protein
MADAMQGKDAVEFLESLIVGDVASLEDRTGTLSVFTNDKGGIIDDSVITKVCYENMHCILLHMLCCCSSKRLAQSVPAMLRKHMMFGPSTDICMSSTFIQHKKPCLGIPVHHLTISCHCKCAR